MATAEDVIWQAESRLGYCALDDPQPGSEAGRYWANKLGEDWLAGPSWEIAWCCLFVSMCCDLATGGHANQLVDGMGENWETCNCDRTLNRGARNQEINKWDARRGDLVIFDWDGNTSSDHIGIALGSPHDGVIDTIEGNTSNSVAEKTRDMSVVNHVVRPHYDGQPGPGPEPSPDEPLEIDGWAGRLTIAKLQAQLGGVVDGVLDGQYRPNRDHFWAITDSALRFDRGTGSPCVERWQQRVGADADGILGPASVEAIQRKLCEMGYAVGVDGYLGNESAEALQRSLNDGRWK